MSSTTTSSTDRTPPHNLDAEESVLGGMIDSVSVIDRVIEVVKPDDFFNPEYGATFEALIDIYSKGQTPNAIALSEELKRRGMYEEVGGGSYIFTLMDAFSTPGAAVEAAHLIANHASLRRLIRAAREVQEIAYSNPPDVAGALANAEQTIFSVVNSQLRHDKNLPAPLEHDIGTVMEELEHEAESDTAAGFTTGIDSLDETLGGIQPGRYIVVGGDTSVGKTSFLTQLDAAAARQGRLILHTSLEMPRRQVIKRVLAQESGVHVHYLTNPRLLEEKDWQKLIDTASKLPAGVLISDGQVNLNMLLARAKRVMAQYRKLDVLVVDYIQLVQGVGRFDNRTQEMDSVSRALKGFANETGVTVIAAAQLSRKATDEKRRPTKRDLRESGAFEQDSDTVILLHRPQRKSSEANLANMKEVEIIVAKNRDGPTGIVDAFFDAPINRFVEQ